MSFLVFFVAAIVIVISLFAAWLALSSCLGDSIRGRRVRSAFSVNPRQGVYDQHNYFRTMTNSGPPGAGYGYSESVEMEDMFNRSNEFNNDR